MSECSPLVSIVVITYNSAAYVLETLESAKVQTYQNIELIITDDGSSDDTVEICQGWLNENQKRFVRTDLLTVSMNTGISANANRGYRAAKGEWIKGIAGDDALLPDCVKDYIDFIQGRPEIEICHSRVEEYKEILDKEHFLRSEVRAKKMHLRSLSAKEQYILLYRGGSGIMAPTVFIKTNLIKRIGYCNEDFPLCDDWPLWLKITNAGNKFYFLNKNTVKYRLRAESACHKKGVNYMQKKDYELYKFIDRNYLSNESASWHKLNIKYRIFLYQFLEKHGFNTRNYINSLVFNFFYFPLKLWQHWDYIVVNGWKYYFRELKIKFESL